MSDSSDGGGSGCGCVAVVILVLLVLYMLGFIDSGCNRLPPPERPAKEAPTDG